MYDDEIRFFFSEVPGENDCITYRDASRWRTALNTF